MTHLSPMNEIQFKQEILPKVIEIMIQNGYTQISEYEFEKSGNIVIVSPDNMGYDSQGNFGFYENIKDEEIRVFLWWAREMC